ncbi:hypothetical protein AZE42_14101 [Rhizopogon vesiculosus]|uniref:Uncharacterized protein n=1 Tax=Rhizopogon vesiculosus TaxID=180088 RepID=A0A1J8Q4V9_9AGAM|nr:hypothetical protein AZE42_14101 [Rhizopogon vesiculosus]
MPKRSRKVWQAMENLSGYWAKKQRTSANKENANAHDCAESFNNN